ncbi:hypothetical protein [Paenibacillus chibensis]|uniref:hypothetical protein n=1 Tax=Paenibacillus chibensis TaxID=59846 RepID=UPI0013E3C523|nr:hypothetical protein [Paenibacillus chibensis]MEC0372316.1 hypothetical protein [Paenibacillus chibensis]
MDKGLKTTYWTPEQIEAHCKAIGADKVPAKSKKVTSITAPQQTQGSNHYSHRGGEW